MLTRGDILDAARSLREKFTSLSDRNVEDYYNDLDLSIDDPQKPPPLPAKEPTFGVDAVLKTVSS